MVDMFEDGCQLQSVPQCSLATQHERVLASNIQYSARELDGCSSVDLLRDFGAGTDSRVEAEGKKATWFHGKGGPASCGR